MSESSVFRFGNSLIILKLHIYHHLNLFSIHKTGLILYHSVINTKDNIIESYFKFEDAFLHLAKLHKSYSRWYFKAFDISCLQTALIFYVAYHCNLLIILFPLNYT